MYIVQAFFSGYKNYLIAMCNSLFDSLQDGQLQSRSWGDASAARYEIDSSKLQRIEYEQFKILFKCLTKWGRNEAGDILSVRAFRVS